jgi:hypothetical protein
MPLASTPIALRRVRERLFRGRVARWTRVGLLSALLLAGAARAKAIELGEWRRIVERVPNPQYHGEIRKNYGWYSKKLAEAYSENKKLSQQIGFREANGRAMLRTIAARLKVIKHEPEIAERFKRNFPAVKKFLDENWRSLYGELKDAYSEKGGVLVLEGGVPRIRFVENPRNERWGKYVEKAKAGDLEALLDLHDEVSWALPNYLDDKESPYVQGVLDDAVEGVVASPRGEAEKRIKDYLKIVEAFQPVQYDATAAEENCEHPGYLADFHHHPRKYVSPDGEEVALEGEPPSEGDVSASVSPHLVFSVRSDGMDVYSIIKGKAALLRKYRVQPQK